MEGADAVPARRRGEVLPADHPAAAVAPAPDDGIAEVPVETKDAVAAVGSALGAWYDLRDQTGLESQFIVVVRRPGRRMVGPR